ncbi:MAG: helix-turn-helix domain-containing protein [Verrucomicrobiota bacterium]
MRANSTPPPNPQPNSATATASLLTRQDVAVALATCLRTVDEAIASGGLEIVAIGRSVRIRPSALESFIDARATRRNPGRVVRNATKSNTTANAGGSL